MDGKAFIGTIFLSGYVAVKSIADKTFLDESPLDIAKKFDDFCVDQLYIINLSKNYIEYECSIGTIEDIVKSVDVPVIVAGCIKGKADIERLLDIGVSKVGINFSKESNIELAKTLKDSFDKERLFGAVTSVNEIYDHKSLMEELCDCLVIMKEQIVTDVLRATNMDVLIPCGDVAPNRLIEILENDNIKAVFGRFVNCNLHDINSIKIILKESGINTSAFEPKLEWADLKTNEANLIPVIVQDYITNEVLMMAWMNQLAFEHTCKTGRMNYYSRSRKSQWVKGETSGHFQYVKMLNADCDSDTLLAKVSQIGAACHTGSRSCFFKEIIKRDIIK